MITTERTGMTAYFGSERTSALSRSGHIQGRALITTYTDTAHPIDHNLVWLFYQFLMMKDNNLASGFHQGRLPAQSAPWRHT